MSHKKHIDQEVEKTLQALDNIEPATTDAFFYSRLSAKMENRETEAVDTIEMGFAFSVAAIFLVLILNVVLISQYNSNGTESTTEREEIIQELANEYQVVDLNYYEFYEAE